MYFSKLANKKISILIVLAMVMSCLLPVFPAGAATSSHLYKVYADLANDELVAGDTAEITAYGEMKNGDEADCYYQFEVKAPGSSKYTLEQEYDMEPSFSIEDLEEGKYKVKIRALTEADYDKQENKKAKKYTKTKYLNFTVEEGSAEEDPVTVTANNVSVEVGETVAANVTTDPTDATKSYESSNTAVATVAADGTITGVAIGTATITVTATADGYTEGSDTFTVTVTAATVGDVVVTATPETKELAIGATQQITATAVPADATITYASSNTAVATVSDTGLITAVAAGTATITVTGAKTDYANGTDTVVVTVTSATADTTAPTFTATAGATNYEFTVAFNEAVKATTGSTITATLTPTTGTAITANVTLSADGTTGTVVIPTTSTVTAMTNSVAYTVALNNVTDMADNALVATATLTPSDTAAPSISAASAIDSKHIKVTFSERVNAATTVTNYTLYAVNTGTPDGIMAAAGAHTLTQIGASAAADASDPNSIIITIVEVGNGLSGYYADAMMDQDYILYANDVTPAAGSITDKAGNYLPMNSAKRFVGVLTPDTTGPQLSSATYDSGLLQLTLTFTEAPTLVDVTKVSIVNGSNTVTMTASNTVSTNGLNMTVTLTAAQNTSLGTIGSNATATVAAGGVKDASSNNNTATTVTLSTSDRPYATATSYDEASKILTVTTNKAIAPSSIQDMTLFSVQYSTDAATWNNLVTGATFGTAGNFTLLTTGSSATEIQFRADSDTAATMTSQKGTANVTYRVGVGDWAFTDISGLHNDTSTTATTDTLQVSMSVTSDSTAPQIASAIYETSTKKMSVRFNETMLESAWPTTTSSLWNNITMSYTSGGTTTSWLSTLSAANTDKIATAPTLATTANTTSGDCMSFTMYFTATADSVLVTHANDSMNLTVATGTGIKDVNRNLLTTGSIPVTVTQNSAVTALTATQHSSKQIRVVPTGGWLDETTAESTANWALNVTGNPNATVALKSADWIDTNGSGVKDTLYLTVADTAALKVNSAVANYYTLAWSNLKDASSTAITNNSTTFASLAADDTTSPTMIDVTSTSSDRIAGSQVTLDADSSNSLTAGDKITLWFNEPVRVPTTMQSAFGSNSSTVVGTESNQLVVSVGASPTLSLGASGTSLITLSRIYDIVGNIFGTADTGCVAYPITSGAPIVSSALYTDVDASGTVNSNDTMLVTFDRAVSVDTVNVSGADFEELPSSATSAIATSKVVMSGTNAILMTLAPASDFNSAASEDNLAVSTTRLRALASISEITDRWGRGASLDTVGAYITMSSTDTTQPAFSSVQIVDLDAGGTIASPDMLLFTFSEGVAQGADNEFRMDDFTVVAPGGSNNPAGVNAAGSSSAIWQLSPTQFVSFVATPDLVALNTTTFRLGSGFGFDTLQDINSNSVAPSSALAVTALTGTASTNSAYFTFTSSDAIVATSPDTLSVQTAGILKPNSNVIVFKANDAGGLIGKVVRLGVNSDGMLIHESLGAGYLSNTTGVYALIGVVYLDASNNLKTFYYNQYGH